MTKIFEIKGDTWMRGLSRQTSSMLGGLFSSALNYDPFEKNGVLVPSYAPVAVTGTAASTLPRFLTPFTSGSTGYIYAHGDSKLYEIDASGTAATDVTASITTGAVKGTDVWRGRYLYALDASVRSIVLHAGTDASVLASLTTSVPHIMATGPDLNEYITNGNLIAKLILESGTAGNILNAFTLESGQVAKDIKSDGKNLVIISDNNPSLATAGRSKCVVSYWDTAKVVADSVYEINDSYLISVRVIDDVTYVIGYNGIYVCSVSAIPRQIFSFLGNSTITERPSSPSQVTVRQGVFYWASSTSSNIYAYGNLLDSRKKIFFSPYTGQGGVTGSNLSLTHTGQKIWSAADSTAASDSVYLLNSPVTRSSTSVTVAPIDFNNRYSFGFVKVVLNSPLTTGQSVLVRLYNKNGNGTVSADDTKTFSTDPNKQTLLFYKNVGTSSNIVTDFEEISSFLITVLKAEVKRVEIWATPLENQYQDA